MRFGPPPTTTRSPSPSRYRSALHSQRVAAALAAGETYPLAVAIARRLGISTHTAKFHVASVIDKLDAVGRTGAVTHAVRLGVIQL